MTKPKFDKMRAGEFLEFLGTDATRWAEAYMAINGHKPADEANLRAWFANAITVGQMNPRHVPSSLNFNRRKRRKHK